MQAQAFFIDTDVILQNLIVWLITEYPLSLSNRGPTTDRTYILHLKKSEHINVDQITVKNKK